MLRAVGAMQLTTNPDIGAPVRTFLCGEFEALDPADIAQIERATEALLKRDVSGLVELAAWLDAWGELRSSVAGARARRTIAFDRATARDDLRESAREFDVDVLPVWDRCEDRLRRRYLQSPYADALGAGYAVFHRDCASTVELFRDQNVALQARDRELVQDWRRIQGGMVVSLDGEEKTMQQVGLVLRQSDRDARERAWRLAAKRRIDEREHIDGQMDELVRLRHECARNAGHATYLDYRFADMLRFDYGPDDCVRFHDAVERIVAPVTRRFGAKRREALGLDALRPWDVAVPLRSQGTLFDTEEELLDLARRLFFAVDPSFAADFDVLERNGMLDLMSRPGKAPGAYNYGIADIDVPFIFGNATGGADDLRTLLHEGGHAFHSLACRGQRVASYRRGPPEFNEVASMAMEHLCRDRFHEVMPAELARALGAGHIERVLQGLTAVGVIDSFQHWLFTTPDADASARADKWVECQQRFSPDTDWSGLTEERRNAWQRIPHLFSHPGYFIAYGIAQIGALQVWRNAQEDHGTAVARYREALALGGSRPLPDLFQAAGARFAMDEEVLNDLVPALLGQLDAFEV